MHISSAGGKEEKEGDAHLEGPKDGMELSRRFSRGIIKQILLKDDDTVLTANAIQSMSQRSVQTHRNIRLLTFDTWTKSS